MKLELGKPIRCADGTVRELADVVLEAAGPRVTHVVVRRAKHPESGRLVPIGLVEEAGALSCTAEALDALEPIREFAYVRAGEQLEQDPEWEVGVEEVQPAPQLEATSFGEYGVDVDQFVSVAYDRVPKGEIELRHASAVYSSDRKHMGSVEGVVIDADARLTHLVLERGHMWWKREIEIPAEAVAKFETDVVTLSVSKPEVEAFPGGNRR